MRRGLQQVGAELGCDWLVYNDLDDCQALIKELNSALCPWAALLGTGTAAKLSRRSAVHHNADVRVCACMCVACVCVWVSVRVGERACVRGCACVSVLAWALRGLCTRVL
jgi:hypothetical protein